MATCRQTVDLALRKMGRLAAGREPRQADAEDAMNALRGLYLSWIASGAFGRLCDVVPTGNTYTAVGNERIFRTKNQDFSVALPELVADYDTCGCRYYGTRITVSDVGGVTTINVETSQPLGYAKPPRDGAPVVVTDSVCGETRSFLYDGSIKKWQGLDGLTLDDQAPRSLSDPQGLAACLVLEIADQFGVDTLPATLRQASRFQTAMTSRFSMPRVQSIGVYV